MARRITFTLSDEVADWIEEEARRRYGGRKGSRSLLVEEILRKAMRCRCPRRMGHED